jgi:L,D-transpeptidase YcbB
MRLRSALGLCSVVTLLSVGVLIEKAAAEDGPSPKSEITSTELEPVPAPPPAPTLANTPEEAKPEPMAPVPAVAIPETTIPAEAATEQSAPNVTAPVETVPSVTAQVDPIVGDVRQRLARASAALSKDERQVLQRAYGIDGAKPFWVGENTLTPRGQSLLGELRRADDWGLKAADFDVPATVPAENSAEQLAELELKLSVAALKYARHARGGRADPTQLSSYLDRRAQLLPPKRVLDEVTAAADPDVYLRKLHPQHPQFEKLRQAFLALRDTKIPVEDVAATTPEPPIKGRRAKAEEPRASGSVRKLLANMEMWRWMPTELGATHLMVNVPEFQFRLIRNGEVIHTERVITGKVDTQTPIFSDMMETVVFKPTWNVPDSIKVKELLPALSRNPGALARQGLRIAHNGREVDPASVDWSTTDIRAFHVFQPPGDANALGIVKFLFPNKHAVYLHDTPTKALFNSTRRAFSHGCIRVRNPVRLAEILMENDRGWSPAQVKAQLAPSAPEAADTALSKKFPVHIAYFTAWANDAGEIQYFNDVYGYETNIHLGLEGKSHMIVKRKEELGPVRAEVVGRMVETRATPANKEWMKTIFQAN